MKHYFFSHLYRVFLLLLIPVSVALAAPEEQPRQSESENKNEIVQETQSQAEPSSETSEEQAPSPSEVNAQEVSAQTNNTAQDDTQETDPNSPQDRPDDAEATVKPDADKVNPLDKVEVNIIKRNNNTIETHSVNGVVYEVKITPSSGPAYYLYDTDGDGTLETRSNERFSDITVQQWKIFEW